MRELEQYRRGIDEADAKIVAAFIERMAFVDKITACKRARGLPIYDAAREEEILRRRLEDVGDPSLRAMAERLLRCLLALSREKQAETLGRTGHE